VTCDIIVPLENKFSASRNCNLKASSQVIPARRKEESAPKGEEMCLSYQIKCLYLGTIVAGDLDEALVAIDNREVDDLSVRQ